MVKYAIDMPLVCELTPFACSILSGSRPNFLDVYINQGAAYGDTIVWFRGTNPGRDEQPVTVNLDRNMRKFCVDLAAPRSDSFKGPIQEDRPIANAMKAAATV